MILRGSAHLIGAHKGYKTNQFVAEAV